MPVDYHIGDRVIYNRANNEAHYRNGQEGVVIRVTGDGYVELRFTTPNRYGIYLHIAAIRNIYMLSSLSKEEAILKTIRKLQKKQYFYQHTGKDLSAWQHLENSA